MLDKDFICILSAYLLGGICTGYYLVRIKQKTDVRAYGSGGVGARNVGRLLGRTGFITTLLGDSLKGLLAVVLARAVGASEVAVAVVLVAVIAGHIWPLFLRFRGGRGIATAVGAYLAFDPVLALLLLGLTVVLMGFRRGFIISGLAAFLLLPITAYALDFSRCCIGALAAASTCILFAHRERIQKFVTEVISPKEA